MSTVEKGKVIERRLANLEELRLWDRNPRRINKDRFESLVHSMRHDPEMFAARPLIALVGVGYAPDGTIIAGNMRYRAAQQLEWDAIETVFVTLTEQEAITWALRDNSPYGEWEEQALAELVYELSQAGVDLDLTGIPPVDLTAMLADWNPDVPGANDEESGRGKALELADVSIGDPQHQVHRHDVWKVGPHTLVVAGVYDEWNRWTGLLEEGMLLVPYPTPTLPLTSRAQDARLLMVQPDKWLAGHVLDKYTAIHGDDAVSKEA